MSVFPFDTQDLSTVNANSLLDMRLAHKGNELVLRLLDVIEALTDERIEGCVIDGLEEQIEAADGEADRLRDALNEVIDTAKAAL